ncbi:MAG: hypothetical protein ACJ72L_17030 [Marmoricola sp.]
MNRRIVVAGTLGVAAIAVIGMLALHKGSTSCPESRTMSRCELELATRIAHQGQARVKGTFIGALASRQLLTHDDQYDTGCPARVLTVRIVWKDDANFEHGHGPAGEAPPDGPLKGALIYVDPTTEHICAQGATYRSIGARPDEKLLYGNRPVDPTGQFR